MDLVELPLDPTSLVAESFESPDYTDRFQVKVTDEPFDTVDQLARRWFKNQPRIIRLVSTNMFRAPIVPRVFGVGQSVGSWKVVGRTANEIIFGESTIVFEYHYSIRLVDPETVEAATAVSIRPGPVGRVFFGLVRPFHRIFVRYLLRSAIAP